MFYYYEKAGKLLASERRDLPYLKAEPAPGTPICYLVEGDPVLGRGSFKVNCPGQLRAPHGLEVLDASRLPDFPLDAPLSAALEEGLLTAVNTGRAGWEQVLSQRAGTEKKRVNILAIGDVGSTLLTGLKLLGGDVISSIGICDLSDQITARWEFEMGQISLPWDYGAFPEVEVISLEKLFDCDVFVFVASRGIPPGGLPGEGRAHGPVRKQRRHCEAVRPHARRPTSRGCGARCPTQWDPLAKTAYLESNRDENGVWMERACGQSRSRASAWG